MQEVQHISMKIPKIKLSGCIVESTTEREDAREEFIKQNQAKGLDTKLSELYDYTEE